MTDYLTEVIDVARDKAITNRNAQRANLNFKTINRKLLEHSQTLATVAPIITSNTIPSNPTAVIGTNGGKVVDNVLLDTVTVQYTSPNPLGSFAGVFLVAKNYSGSATLVKVGEDTFLGAPGTIQSFVTILQRTNEAVTFYVVPKSGTEVTPDDWTTCPSFVLTLNGQISAPAAPTFAQTLASTPTGYQFIFNQVVAASQVIDSYKVYRNTSFTTSGATVIRTFKHDQTNVGATITVQDTATDGVPYFYYVSSVNTAGLESSLAAAQSGTVFATIPMTMKGTPVVSSPVIPSNSLTSGGGLGQWVAANTATLPGSIEWDVYSTGGIIDVLLWASTGGTGPNGYLLRFDARTGHPAGQILKVTNGTWANIGTSPAANNAVALAGWHNVTARVTGQGQFDIFVDGVWETTAIDTTFAPTGAMYYGYEVTSGSMISPTGFNVDPSQPGFITKGSTPVSANGIALNGMTWATTGTSVTFSWVQTPIFRADGTLTGFITTGSQAITGLLASQNYTAYPYFDEPTQSMKWVSTELVFPTLTCISLNGSTGFVQTTTGGTHADIGATGQYTLEFWINSTSATNQGLMSFSAPQGSGAHTAMQVQVVLTAAGEISFAYANTTPVIKTVTTSGAQLLDGANHHIVITFATGGNIVIYVDTVSKGTGAALGAQGTAGATCWYHIGFADGTATWPFTTNTFLNGKISNVAVYSGTPLTTAQISNHFVTGINVGFTGTHGYQATVIADSPTYYWKLNETSGTAATESISGTNAGTYSGGFVLNQQAAVVAPSGSPAYLWPYKNYLCTQAQALQSRIPLSAGSLTPATTSGGAGSGGGGGDGGGGQGGCWSGNTLVKTPDGPVRMDQWVDGTLVLTAAGTWKPAVLKKHESRRWKMLDPMANDEFVTIQHGLLTDSGWKRAHAAFPAKEIEVLEGPVYDLSVDVDEQESQTFSRTTEHSYTLNSGIVAHNNIKK